MSITEEQPFHVKVDYDWTLFDTTSFSTDLWRQLAQETGEDPKQVRRDSKLYYADTTLGGYDFESHIKSYELDSDRMWRTLGELVVAKDYLFPDSVPFMSALVTDGFAPSVLSFGDTRFQKAKIQPYLATLAGGIAHDETTVYSPIGCEIVLQKKGQVIEAQHPNERGVLVDDIANQNLPPGFTEITIDRTRQDIVAPLELPNGYVVSGLEQALQLIRALKNE